MSTTELPASKIPPATPDSDGNVTYTTNVESTAARDTEQFKIRSIRRGRHPAVTKGAFGNGRNHNGIKFRSSSLIRRFR